MLGDLVPGMCHPSTPFKEDPPELHLQGVKPGDILRVWLRASALE